MPDPWREALTRYQQAAPYARGISDVVSQTGPQPFGQFIEPSLQAALKFQMEQGGMPQEQFDIARRGLGGALGGALSRIAGASGRRGFFDPTSMARKSEQPMRAFGQGLAGLYGQKAQLRQKAMSEAMRTTAGLAGIPAAQSRAEQMGYGTLLQGMAGQRPGWRVGKVERYAGPSVF